MVSYVNHKLCMSFSEDITQQGAGKLENETKYCPDVSRKDPQRASKTTLATEEIPRGSPGGGPRPQRRPRGQRGNFGYPRGFFGGPQETPLAKQWRRANSVIWYESATLATKMAHWKTKDVLTIVNENMQKPLFFQCKTAFDARAETPPGGAINAPCGHQMLLFDMNQLHSTNWKTRAPTSDKNEKTFFKKWVWRQLHTLGLPGAASWRQVSKSELFVSTRRAVFQSERFVSTKSASEKNLVFFTTILKENHDGKKSRKK